MKRIDSFFDVEEICAEVSNNMSLPLSVWNWPDFAIRVELDEITRRSNGED